MHSTLFQARAPPLGAPADLDVAPPHLEIQLISFFSVLCNSGDQHACGVFTSEIMITGYVILFCMILVLVTSNLRHTLVPYSIFYALHHIVLLLYVILAARRPLWV
ncbi:hypothetical protein T492DRAFT_875559 [Pavlovales sp. CCMP2436]|nr:hypothetical protein T492DRAFT_875559 [Pavlovales sp. CCMP2436]